MKLSISWGARSVQFLPRIPKLNLSEKTPIAHRLHRRRLTSALRLSSVIVVAALSSGPLFAQKGDAGLPEDWSHHHVVFSNPGSLGEASGQGAFGKWYRVVSSPRFTFQQLKRGSKRPIQNGNNPGTPEKPLSRDWSVPLGGAGVAPDMFPAKWQFTATPTPSCSDYVVFPVNKAGVLGSQPNLVAYQNLYVNSGGTGVCPGTAPTVLFSYFVGTGTVQTSPVLGGSGGEIAYVESVAGGSKFHVLKGAGKGASNGTAAAPAVPGTGNTASDVSITLNGAVSVTRSSPYYDYSSDVAYVGDDSGKLHKFTPVFNGTPAEVTTGGWPVTVSTQISKILTAPVFDEGKGLAYVGDSTGYLYSVSATGAVVQSGHLGSALSGIVDAPLLDSSAETLYVFVGENFAGTGSAVFAFNVSAGITGGSSGTSVTVGTGSTTVPMYDGTFDNAYYSSSTFRGNLYVCGNTGGNPTLYVIPITYSSGPVLGSVVTGPALASSHVGCSPLTEFYNSNSNIDWLFGGVGANSCGASVTTAGGCVISFNITTALTATTPGPWTPSTAFALNSQIVDTKGNLQRCIGTYCGATGGVSGTATPSWTLTTTSDGTTANAGSVGTVSANSAAGGATLTIGSLTLTASAPTQASSPILINSEPGGGNTITINGTVYDWRTSVGNCNAGENCIARSATLGTDATNLANAINGTSCFNTCVHADPTVTATVSGNSVTVTAKTPGTGANADVLSTSNSGAIHINGAANASTKLGGGTGTLGTDGSSTAPNFQYWSGSSAVSTSVLASNISAAAAGNSANVTLTYVSGNAFTATGTGINAGAPGNSVAIGGTLTGFTWNPNGHLAGGTSPLTWAYQVASNGQTTAPEPTGTSGIVVDNGGSGQGEANIYFGTLTGTGATNSAVKMTQAGLQ